MSMQEFALQLEQRDEPPPLLQALQTLRECTPDQLRAALDQEEGWVQWPSGATE